MSKVKIEERIYVDANGKRVDESYKGMKTLAAIPGDLMSEERAAALGVKEKKRVEDKAAEKSETKGIFGGKPGRGK